MANIEKYLADGLSLHPESYDQDVPCSLFDFPACELVVASLVRTPGPTNDSRDGR